MGADSKIEWTDATWNPVRGCSKVSEGCRNCYAMGVASRFAGLGLPYEGLAKRTPHGPEWTNKITLVPDALDLPLRWRKPRRIFVNSMSDLFHEHVPFDFIDEVFAVMALTPHHTFQILTKRPERMREYCATTGRFELILQDAYRITHDFMPHTIEWPLGNVWLGTSVENQTAADARIPALLKIPAVVRFLSVEPLLGPVNLSNIDGYDCLNGYVREANGGAHGGLLYPAIHLVIVGGESGHGARPMHPDWARSVRDQCVAAGVPFFFKQWGAWEPVNYVDLDGRRWVAMAGPDRNEILLGDGVTPPGRDRPDLVNMRRVGKKRAGRLLDGRTWNEFPEVRHA